MPGTQVSAMVLTNMNITQAIPGIEYRRGQVRLLNIHMVGIQVENHVICADVVDQGYLGFRLTGPGFLLAPSVVSLVFVASLAGTWASARAGREAARFGRKPVLLVSIAVMSVGVAITLSDNLFAVLAGLVVATAGFFGAHSIASGWAGQAAPAGKAQASSLYNLFYYGGSSVIGWFGGVAFDRAGWTAVAGTVLALAAVSAAAAALLRD